MHLQQQSNCMEQPQSMGPIRFRLVHLKRISILAVVVIVIVSWYISSQPDKSPVAKTVFLDMEKNLGQQLHVADVDIHERGVAKKRMMGLRADGANFTLDGKPVRLLSGAMHYFRVVPEYWRDRMLKMKAAGLNTLETYVPWNLHEPKKYTYNFKGILDLGRYLDIAHEVGLWVILRPGPYICAEWEFGGLPGWLATAKEHVRTTRPLFMDPVEVWFGRLLAEVVPRQYTNGGPIIAVQIENEYGSYGNDTAYMERLEKILESRGIVELLFTSDNLGGLFKGGVPGVLKTINFQDNATHRLQNLKEMQPDRPMMVMEYWTGWFDHWREDHHIYRLEKFERNLIEILDAGASVNFYMFHGGTNFGFMNGANTQYKTGGRTLPTVTSYDYDAPISETGDLTPKYFKIREILKSHTPPGVVPERLPEPPTTVGKFDYGRTTVTKALPLDKVLPLLEQPISSTQQNVHGLGYGYMLYTATVNQKPERLTVKGVVRDRALVMINDIFVGEMDEDTEDIELDHSLIKGDPPYTLKILVENQGRVNYGSGLKNQIKGIIGDVYINTEEKVAEFKVYTLDMSENFLQKLSAYSDWTSGTELNQVKTPAFYRATFTVEGRPKDTFVHMFKGNWEKGVVIVNHNNLGRYWNIGPQQTLYLPAPFLKEGENEIIVFEERTSAPEVLFCDKPSLGEIVYFRE
ncbi:PREDICTED: beta-galactosidase-1-like protein 2 [Branchiostoma belcheri]|uniref:Beta-galactosidase n=1 Tax=Branchiostoma belcheri TaxID=7741 RepID=A0A6P4Y5P2_BRABE|nr:PREDICTED: beta-galactosidase-1-like protein 2 [Branchiostoma belcheri]